MRTESAITFGMVAMFVLGAAIGAFVIDWIKGCGS